MPRGSLIQALLKKAQRNYTRDLHPEQKSALEDYVDHGSRINYYLRSGSSEDLKYALSGMERSKSFDSWWSYGTRERTMDAQIQKIDDAIGEAPRLDQPISLFRRVTTDNPMLPAEFEQPNPGYTSTGYNMDDIWDSGAADHRIPGVFDRIQRIDIPEDSPMLELSDLGIWAEESEVLLPRGMELRRVGESPLPRRLLEGVMENPNPDDKFAELLLKYDLQGKFLGGLVHGGT